MRKTTLLLMAAAAAVAIIFGACVSERGGRGPGGPVGGPDRDMRGGRESGAPAAAESALMTLRGLMEAGEKKPELALTDEQKAAILTALKEWLTAAETDPRADGAAFAKKISAVLTAGQKSYRPAPPQGGPGGMAERGDPGNRGPGGPGGAPVPIAELLAELIEAIEE